MANNEIETLVPAESGEDFDWSGVEADYRAEMDTDYWSEVEQGRWDDDPNPYHGDYAEDDGY